MHVFWHCEKAREVWRLSGISVDTRGAYYHDFVDLLWHLKFIQHVDNELLSLINSYHGMEHEV